MAQKSLRRVLQAAVLLMFSSSLLWRCANISSPQGGPKDSLPPIIVSAAPMFNTTEFTGNTITIGFDEYVVIKDQQKEFFTSPMMKRTPKLTTIGKTIRITILDTLAENQTYALNFGSSVVDNNEGNILSDLRYVFSTGREIDSMVMSGYTVSASKGDSVSKSLIFFYPAEVDSIPDYDSILFKHKPAVVARAANNGIFVAQNLKPIDYKIYAIQDNNNNYTYDPETDMVGFLDSVRNPLREPDFSVWYDTTRHYLTANPQIYFKMFTDGRFKRQSLAESKRPEQHKVTLLFGAPQPEILEFSIDSIAPEEIITEYETKGRDTINYWLNVPSERLGDTLRGRVIYLKHDSVNSLVPDTAKLELFWKYFESKEEKKAREEEEKKKEKALRDSVEYIPPKVPNPFKVDFSRGELNPERPLTFTFAMPLTEVDTTAIELYYVGEVVDNPNQSGPMDRKGRAGAPQMAADSTAVAEKEPELPKVDFTFEQDTANMKIWHLRSQWKPKSKYRMMIPAGAFRNVASQQNDTIKLDFNTFDLEKYGSVLVNVMGKRHDSRYVIYLRNEGGKVIDEVRHAHTGVYRFNYVQPGKVRVSVLEDNNDNGIWDTGNLIERRQPERTEPYVDERGEEIIEVKANWEIEVKADMNQLFAPITFESVNEQLRKTEAVRLKKLLEDREKRRQEELKRQQQGEGGGLGGFTSSMGSMKSAVSSMGGMGGMR